MYSAVNACFFLSLSPQFLCLKNIRTFLKVCHDKFGLRNSELFDPFDLFDVRDFGKVRPTSSWGRASLVLFFHLEVPSSGVDDVMVPCKAVARGDNSTCGRPVTFKTGRGLVHLRKDARSRAFPFSLISLARFILSTLRSRRQRSK